ncbi:MAG: ribose-phosphate pyrophosphokinase [Firmicutes bacterium]|nr:ribose-phosphate pyrophosphokinase [Bacillota bacterium]NLL87325.1 ribose-phosphate pyrophosphokinase [Bacillota bacterium]
MRVSHYDKKLKLVTGNANPELAKNIAACLSVELGKAEVGRFQDGEISIKILETVRGHEVFIIQPTHKPTDTHLMELLLLIDAIKRASAKMVAAVIPYYGYARQDRKTQPRDSIGAKLVANLLAAAGADRVVTMDLHADQIQGFFDIPVDNLRAMPIIERYLKSKELDNYIVVAPDVGGVVRARTLAKRLNCPMAIVDKRRPAANVSQVMNIIGDVQGKTCVLFDDIIDTGGTIIQGAQALIDNGAKTVYACCTHAVFSGQAPQLLQESVIQEVIATDTINIIPDKRFPKLTVLSVAALFAEAIRRIFEELPVSKLFD